MELILSRHGNTFNPGDPVVWAGSTNDLSLVKTGILQAEILAKTLKGQKIYPSGVYCSPLKRTYAYAKIIIETLKLPFQPSIDIRLTEIDYGAWTGLTHEQVRSRFGITVLQNWENHSQWPPPGHWNDTEPFIINQTLCFIKEMAEKHKNLEKLLIITSNGRLRYFLKCIKGAFELHLKTQQFKIKTGHIAKIKIEKKKERLKTTLCYWNQEPNPHFKI